jgi:meiotic recombination protein DMC1
VEQLCGLLAEDRHIRMVIVDSIMATFRCDYIGRGELSERQQRLNVLLANLKRLAECHHIADLLTNQMQSDPGANMSFVPDPKKPVGGHILAHAVHVRIALRKGSGDQRIAKIVQSSAHSERDATYLLSPGGVADG